MQQEDRVVMGLWIERNMGQISCFHKGMKEPETLFMGDEQSSCQMPAVAYKFKGENRWSFGEAGYKSYMLGECVRVEGFVDCLLEGRNVEAEEEEYSPSDITEAFLRYMIQRAAKEMGERAVACVAVCTGLFQKRFLDQLKMLILNILQDVEVLFMNREEGFVFYALSMKEELRRNAVILFDYDGSRFQCRKTGFGVYGKKTVVMVEERDFSGNGGKLTEDEMTAAAEDCMGREQISSVYLTGSGFEEIDKLDGFIKYVCSRRRVFAGQNLYSRGACYAAFDMLYGKMFSQMLIACRDRILYDIDVEILDHGTLKVYRAVRAGTNWYEADKCVNFIICGRGNLKLNITPVENRPPYSVVIGMDVFPIRPDRTTRIEVQFLFERADVMKIIITDKGFGKFFKASEGRIVKEINLMEG